MSNDDAPPGSPVHQVGRLQGPWLQTQLTISIAAGGTSLLIFCFIRNRWTAVFAPRTLLRGFSPIDAHGSHGFFSWILPTLRVSEFTVLQVVGLDAAVLLNTFKVGFYFFLTCSVLAWSILVPINYRENGTSEGVAPDPPSKNSTTTNLIGLPVSFITANPKEPAGTTPFLATHLFFTYAFSLLALYLFQRYYKRFTQSRQLFSLDHAHSIPARTVLLSNLPPHLRSDRVLSEYFEAMSLGVESVNVVRKVTRDIENLLYTRTLRLRELEEAWTEYLGNPARGSKEAGYNRDDEVKKILEGVGDAKGEGRSKGYYEALTARRDDAAEGHPPEDTEAHPSSSPADVLERVPDNAFSIDDDEERTLLATPPVGFAWPNKKRPTKRVGWSRKKIDKLDWLAKRFREADQAVEERRHSKLRPEASAFVTFETLADAQIAAQTVHYSRANLLDTTLAPEPRDVHWANMSLSGTASTVRNFLGLIMMIALLFTWSAPVTFLARLLSYDAIKNVTPGLAHLIDRSPQVRVLVQNSLPSLALVAFNAFLPILLEYICIFQGLRARSWIEYSLLRKYHFFLLINTFFVFIAVSTAQLAKDLADQPMKIAEKFALSLPGARKFFISYVILQGLAIMPLQLLQLAVILPRWFYQVFYTRTPRDHAELNAPPILNLGVVYPQAILIFLICITYSIISPLILIFGTIYFGMGYLVYKYKLLFVFYRSYESRGEAWPISFDRMCWGIVIFQLFMLGLFTLQQAFILTVAMVPLILFTVYAAITMHRNYDRLSSYVNLSQACEVQKRGETQEQEHHLRRGHPVTRSQTQLNRGRYAATDDTLFVVGINNKTDYLEPPMSESYFGVLNTGRRRYGHPALSGQLPQPWLPRARPKIEDATEIGKVEAIVIDIRRNLPRHIRSIGNKINASLPFHRTRAEYNPYEDEDSTRAWRGVGKPGQSADEDFGVTPLDSEEDDEEGGHQAYKTYFPHPERTRKASTSHPNRSHVTSPTSSRPGPQPVSEE